MPNNVLIVPNAYEGFRYKKRFPTMLSEAKLFFPDDTLQNVRKRDVHTIYYTIGIPENSYLFQYFRPAVPPVLLPM